MKNFKFTINGNEYEVDLIDVEAGMARIEVNGTLYDVHLHRDVPQQKPKPVAPVQKVQKEPVATVTPVKQGGQAVQVKSPLPGVIIQVLVKQGDNVTEGQSLCTLETMKMENAIKCEKAGVVSSVKITPGQSVLQDEVLIEIS